MSRARGWNNDTVRAGPPREARAWGAVRRSVHNDSVASACGDAERKKNTSPRGRGDGSWHLEGDDCRNMRDESPFPNLALEGGRGEEGARKGRDGERV